MADRIKRELFDLAASLTRQGRSFVIATVVRRDGLSSAHQGDMAIIEETGAFHGWVGGGCTRPTVEREAALTLATKQPRLINLSPEPDRDPRPGVRALPMTCSSGGTVEIYLDPMIAAPRLALFGRSPIIAALAAIAHEIGYLVDVADPDAHADEFRGADRVFTSVTVPELDGASFVVVGTMGDLDETAVIRALALQPKYLGVIASRRRYALLRDALIARGVDVGALASIENPAGLDLGARDAGEVAVSILAQIVARRNASAVAAPEPMPADATAIDPVCKMTVTIATAKHVGEWGGSRWYFCCGGCKTKFLAEPTKFVAITERGAG
ncbi:MAG TPA: XdhC family protein [Kofleriaceae bacterium]|jgi:xanthine dehydrogenase accessory factor|nr:XdhC family protein [Kofleriaceae bacterium]